MGSPLGPLLANTFMCSLEEKLKEDGEMPSYYKRYVDDTLAIMPGLQAATSFLDVLNSKHPSLNFTMETTTDSTLPFLGKSISKNAQHLVQVSTESQRILGSTCITTATLTTATRSVC